jgi:hypothetical protein
MIGVLHGGKRTGVEGNIEELAASSPRKLHENEDEESRALMSDDAATGDVESRWEDDGDDPESIEDRPRPTSDDWKTQIRLLSISFAVSGIYVSFTEPNLPMAYGH